MTAKIILVPYAGKDKENAALETAAELAQRWKAHVAVWHILPEPQNAAMTAYADMGAMLGYVPGALFQELEQRNKAIAALVHSKYAAFIKQAGLSETRRKTGAGATASFHTAYGRPDEVLKIQARLADLTVISHCHNDDEGEPGLPATSILMESGRPVLLVPERRESAKPLGHKTVIAWNGSPECVRAVAAALPLLQSGRTTIVSDFHKNPKKFPLGPQDLADYLARHGINAKPVLLNQKNVRSALAILQQVKKADANLLVMGGFSHSRARELILGGVINYMLGKAPVPVLMAH